MSSSGLSKDEIKMTVPILVDGVRSDIEFPLARCVYFSIQSDSPSSDWRMTLGRRGVRFSMMGLSGVVRKSLKGRTFTTAESIDELFGLVEEHPALRIGTDDIWLPESLFQLKPSRGEVYRIPYSLFEKAHAYRGDRIAADEYLKHCEELRAYIRFSRSETKAFKEWASRQVKRAFEKYHEHPDRGLKYREEQSSPGHKGGGVR
jgi:hypothetical protein